MYVSPEARRRLEDIREAHEALLGHIAAGDAHRHAFRAVYEALESAIADVEDAELDASAADGGWSPMRVLMHLAEHDRQIEEARERGIEHMIEHGLEHARDLWVARAARTGATSGSA